MAIKKTKMPQKNNDNSFIETHSEENKHNDNYSVFEKKIKLIVNFL